MGSTSISPSSSDERPLTGIGRFHERDAEAIREGISTGIVDGRGANTYAKDASRKE